MKQTGLLADRNRSASARLSSVPMEWLGGGPWRLPSGKALAEFALQAGFLAPLLLEGRPDFGGGFLSGMRRKQPRRQERTAE